MAASFDDEADPTRLALVDLSPLPRFGLKGADAESILRASGFDAPAFGRAALQPGGETAAGLGGGEFLILCAPDGGLAAQKTVAAAVAARAKKSQPEAMTLPRRDSHGWFALCGDDRFAAAARLCAIDLRAGEVFFDSLRRRRRDCYRRLAGAGFASFVRRFAGGIYARRDRRFRRCRHGRI